MSTAMRPPCVCRTGLAAACMLTACLWLAGCAGPSGFLGGAGASQPFRNPDMSMQAAMQAVAVGQSSKQDVMAALGAGTVVRFDSGHEVWVYRKNPLRSEAANAEFVILFAPSGIVKKTRIRPATSLSPH